MQPAEALYSGPVTIGFFQLLSAAKLGRDALAETAQWKGQQWENHLSPQNCFSSGVTADG